MEDYGSIENTVHHGASQRTGRSGAAGAGAQSLEGRREMDAPWFSRFQSSKAPKRSQVEEFLVCFGHSFPFFWCLLHFLLDIAYVADLYCKVIICA